MPIYEYRCTECDHRLEKLQRMADDPLVDCPECGHPSLKKLVSAAAFKLKGSGWYETDFKDKKKAESGSTSKKEPSTASKSDDSNVKSAPPKKDSKRTPAKSDS